MQEPAKELARIHKHVRNLQNNEYVCWLFCRLQLAQHNKELAALLKPSEKSEPQQPLDKAVEHYANHTAQIEVCILSVHNMVRYWIHTRKR